MKQIISVVIISMLLLLSGCAKEGEQKTTDAAAEEQTDIMQAVRDADPHALLGRVRDILNKPDAKLDAVQFNDAGYELYKAKKYAEAAVLFSAASILKPDYEYANYNLACTLALLKESGADIEDSEIIRLLERSLELDPGKISHIKKDADLTVLKNNQEFKAMLARPVPAAVETTPVSRQRASIKDFETITIDGEAFITMSELVEAMKPVWNKITGGKPVMLPDEELLPSGFTTLSAASLSPGGTKLFFVVNRYFAATDINVYGVISIQSGTIHYFEDGVKHGDVHEAHWSPDEKHIACYSGDASGASSLYVGSLSTRKGRLQVRGSQLLAALKKIPYRRDDYGEGQGGIMSLRWVNNSVLQVGLAEHIELEPERTDVYLNIEQSSSSSIVLQSR